MKKSSRKICVILAVLAVAISPLAAAGLKQYEIDYIKGDIKAKAAAVEQAGLAQDNELPMQALNMALSVSDTLSRDPELDALVVSAVGAISRTNPSENSVIAAKLGETFKKFNDDPVRLAVLRKFYDFPSAANTSLVNAYVTERMQLVTVAGQKEQMDDVLLSSITYLGRHGNNSTFSILFIADLLGIWQEQKELLRATYTPLANNCENEILSILSNVDMSKKLEILEITSQSDSFSQKICAEVAENAFSASIYNIGEMTDISQAQVEVQMAALQTISDTQWTRAASMATDYFDIARQEYELNLLTPEQFSGIIENIASVASSETGQVLSSYLDFLNKSMESKDAPVEAVVLSVIKALGGLGDKAAFDYLLYVTYLDYPEPVVKAARDALAKLKW